MLKGELACLSSYFSDSLTCTLIKVSIMYALVIIAKYATNLCEKVSIICCRVIYHYVTDLCVNRCYFLSLPAIFMLLELVIYFIFFQFFRWFEVDRLGNATRLKLVLVIFVQSRPWSHLAKILQIYIFYINMIRIDTKGNKVFYLFILSFVRSIVRSFVRSFVRPFVHSFIHSFIHSGQHHFDLRLMTCDLWRVTCDLWLVTYDLWLMTCDLWLVTFDLWPLTCDFWRLTCDVWLVTFELWQWHLVM